MEHRAAPTAASNFPRQMDNSNSSSTTTTNSTSSSSQAAMMMVSKGDGGGSSNNLGSEEEHGQVGNSSTAKQPTMATPTESNSYGSSTDTNQAGQNTSQQQQQSPMKAKHLPTTDQVTTGSSLNPKERQEQRLRNFEELLSYSDTQLADSMEQTKNIDIHPLFEHCLRSIMDAGDNPPPSSPQHPITAVNGGSSGSNSSVAAAALGLVFQDTTSNAQQQQKPPSPSWSVPLQLLQRIFKPPNAAQLGQPGPKFTAEALRRLETAVPEWAASLAKVVRAVDSGGGGGDAGSEGEKTPSTPEQLAWRKQRAVAGLHMWAALISAFGGHIVASSRELTNALCSVMSGGFKSQEAEVVGATLRGWQALIGAFATEKNWSSVPVRGKISTADRRLELILKGLRHKMGDEITNEVFDAWWFLAKSLGPKLPHVFDEVVHVFLRYCLGGRTSYFDPQRVLPTGLAEPSAELLEAIQRPLPVVDLAAAAATDGPNLVAMNNPKLKELKLSHASGGNRLLAPEKLLQLLTSILKPQQELATSSENIRSHAIHLAQCLRYLSMRLSKEDALELPFLWEALAGRVNQNKGAKEEDREEGQRQLNCLVVQFRTWLLGEQKHGERVANLAIQKLAALDLPASIQHRIEEMRKTSIPPATTPSSATNTISSITPGSATPIRASGGPPAAGAPTSSANGPTTTPAGPQASGEEGKVEEPFPTPLAATLQAQSPADLLSPAGGMAAATPALGETPAKATPARLFATKSALRKTPTAATTMTSSGATPGAAVNTSATKASSSPFPSGESASKGKSRSSSSAMTAHSTPTAKTTTPQTRTSGSGNNPNSSSISRVRMLRAVAPTPSTPATPGTSSGGRRPSSSSSPMSRPIQEHRPSRFPAETDFVGTSPRGGGAGVGGGSSQRGRKVELATKSAIVEQQPTPTDSAKKRRIAIGNMSNTSNSGDEASSALKRRSSRLVALEQEQQQKQSKASQKQATTPQRSKRASSSSSSIQQATTSSGKRACWRTPLPAGRKGSSSSTFSSSPSPAPPIRRSRDGAGDNTAINTTGSSAGGANESQVIAVSEESLMEALGGELEANNAQEVGETGQEAAQDDDDEDDEDEDEEEEDGATGANTPRKGAEGEVSNKASAGGSEKASGSGAEEHRSRSEQQQQKRISSPMASPAAPTPRLRTLRPRQPAPGSESATNKEVAGKQKKAPTGQQRQQQLPGSSAARGNLGLVERVVASMSPARVTEPQSKQSRGSSTPPLPTKKARLNAAEHGGSSAKTLRPQPGRAGAQDSPIAEVLHLLTPVNMLPRTPVPLGKAPPSIPMATSASGASAGGMAAVVGTPQSPAEMSLTAPDGSTEPAKRGRGRPRKIPKAVAESEMPVDKTTGKGRGRPRKSISATPATPTANSNDDDTTTATRTATTTANTAAISGAAAAASGATPHIPTTRRSLERSTAASKSPSPPKQPRTRQQAVRTTRLGHLLVRGGRACKAAATNKISAQLQIRKPATAHTSGASGQKAAKASSSTSAQSLRQATPTPQLSSPSSTASTSAAVIPGGAQSSSKSKKGKRKAEALPGEEGEGADSYPAAPLAGEKGARRSLRLVSTSSDSSGGEGGGGGQSGQARRTLVEPARDDEMEVEHNGDASDAEGEEEEVEEVENEEEIVGAIPTIQGIAATGSPVPAASKKTKRTDAGGSESRSTTSAAAAQGQRTPAGILKKMDSPFATADSINASAIGTAGGSGMSTSSVSRRLRNRVHFDPRQILVTPPRTSSAPSSPRTQRDSSHLGPLQFMEEDYEREDRQIDGEQTSGGEGGGLHMEEGVRGTGASPQQANGRRFLHQLQSSVATGSAAGFSKSPTASPSTSGASGGFSSAAFSNAAASASPKSPGAPYQPPGPPFVPELADSAVLLPSSFCRQLTTGSSSANKLGIQLKLWRIATVGQFARLGEADVQLLPIKQPNRAERARTQLRKIVNAAATSSSVPVISLDGEEGEGNAASYSVLGGQLRKDLDMAGRRSKSVLLGLQSLKRALVASTGGGEPAAANSNNVGEGPSPKRRSLLNTSNVASGSEVNSDMLQALNAAATNSAGASPNRMASASSSSAQANSASLIYNNFARHEQHSVPSGSRSQMGAGTIAAVNELGQHLRTMSEHMHEMSLCMQEMGLCVQRIMGATQSNTTATTEKQNVPPSSSSSSTTINHTNSTTTPLLGVGATLEGTHRPSPPSSASAAAKKGL